MITTPLRRDTLHEFLLAHRRRIQPEVVGLPARGRRATPGLRREEVASLAGVSVSWYTRLEQGHPIGVSPEVVDSIAKVLQLTPAETTYFHVLARSQVPVEKAQRVYDVQPHTQQLLDGFATYPACVITPFWDVIAWNTMFCRVFGDYAQFTHRERNTIWRLFVDPSWRILIDNWEYEARKAVMIFRYSTRAYAEEPWFKAFIEDLFICAPEFETWWREQHVRMRHDEPKVLCHPIVGKLALLPTTLQIVEESDLRVVVDLPISEFDTPSKLQQLGLNL